MAAPADKQVMKLNTPAAITFSSSLTANTAFKVDAANGDYKTVLLIKNGSGASVNVTIAKGDGPRAARKDLTFAVADGAIEAVVLDSAYFKQYALEDFVNGYKVTATGAVTAAALELPQ